jgi:hypothetical protein
MFFSVKQALFKKFGSMFFWSIGSIFFTVPELSDTFNVL